jgi:hydrogenase-4 membrane subunit HyfE
MPFALTKSLAPFCGWLEQTPLSQVIQATNWVVPAVQSVHILAIAVVASSALMIDLRLLRLAGADQPMGDILARFLPFLWWSLLALLATGTIMIIGEPARSLLNPAFQLKMTLLIAALVVTGLFQILARRNASFGDRPRAAAVAIAVVSILLWSAIVFAGRWIAYYA